MMPMRLLPAALPLLLAGCSLAPATVLPAPPVPESWPVGDAYLAQSESALPILSWRDIFTDARLQSLMDRNTSGQLSPTEREELEALAELSETISLVRAQALKLLGRTPA